MKRLLKPLITDRSKRPTAPDNDEELKWKYREWDHDTTQAGSTISEPANIYNIFV